MSSEISELGSSLKNLVTSLVSDLGAAESGLSSVVEEYSEAVGEAIEGFSNLQDVVEYSQQGIQILNDITTGNYWSLATDIATDTAVDLSGILGGYAGAADAGVQSAAGQYRGAQVSAATGIGGANGRFREAQDDFDIALRSMALARHNVQLVRDRYAARQASQSDVDSAEVLAVQAAQSLASAQLTLRLSAWERYRWLDGQDFPETLIAAVLNRGASGVAPGHLP